MSGKPTKRVRVSLTKIQIQQGIGAELLALCQGITHDGTFTKEEIVALKRWLRENRNADLPSVAFLMATIERIIADKRITRDEQDELYKAIETVLPPEARKLAKQSRRAVAAKEQANELAASEAATRKELAERERDAPVDAANFMVAGVHFENRSVLIERYVEYGLPVFLARDHENRFSRFATEVRVPDGYQIGFVPEEFAEEVAPLIDKGALHKASITKVLRGGRVPIPVVQAYFYRPDAQVEGAVSSANVPPKQLVKRGWFS